MNRAAIAVVAGVGGLVVGLLVAGVLLPAPAPGQGKSTVITLSPHPQQAGRCVATTADRHVRLRRDHFMLWRIDDKCPRPAGSVVELRFEGEGPFNSPNLRGDNVILDFVRQDPKPDYRSYPYKVWLIPAEGSPYEMEDPEIEIVWWL